MSEASRAWSWRHAFSSSSLPATTKHVLHTLGMFMNELGEGCYPSVADICRYSGLDKKTVLKHLAMARDAGWIAVSQHGYRGQKWKRQEYAARWPERDLTAPCQPDADQQGGGAVPPPSDDAKVVESSPQGGGIGGSKVVEQVHQDKTSPVTTPDTSPVEREVRAREPEDRESEDPKQIDREGWKLLKDWPGFAGMPKEPALKAWRAMPPGDRAEAAAKFPHWLALLKAQGKSHIPAPATYFRERLFADVSVPDDDRPTVAEAKPFGPLWQAARMKHLLAGPTVEPVLTRIDRMLIQEGRFAEADLLREKQAKTGFPAINSMHDKASFRQGVTVSLALEPLAGLMEPVPVGSPMFEEWRLEHERRGWPWLPDTGAQPVVYFPQGGPAGLEEFEAAVALRQAQDNEGCGNDGGQREAAE